MTPKPMKAATSAVFDFFFCKPVPVIIWIFMLVMVGTLGFSSMVKESLPDLEIPQAYVVTTWEGASPAMVEKEITQKIEAKIKGMKGLKNYYSASQQQISIVAVNFHAEMGVKEALLLLQRKVNAAAALFPKDAEKPRIEESSVRDLPIATFTLSGPLSKSVLEQQARRLQERIEKIQGIKKVSLVGESREMVQVLLQPERIKALGIPPTLVRQAIISRNYDAPWGRFEDNRLGFRLKMEGALKDLETLRQLPVYRLPEGNLIRLKDVALVRKGFMRETTRASLSWQGGEFVSVVAMNLFKSSGQDTVKLVRKASQVMAEAAQGDLWPKDLSWQVSGDQAKVIQDELDRGFSNGWQAMLAVFVVLMVMLTWRAALVAAVSVPLTLLGVVAVLWAMGYSFNLLVIVGMIFALGLLIDDFILIMEGMHEGLFVQKLGFVQAVKRTVKTYAVPSLSGSVTTILVLLPLAFLGGGGRQVHSPDTGDRCGLPGFVLHHFRRYRPAAVPVGNASRSELPRPQPYGPYHPRSGKTSFGLVEKARGAIAQAGCGLAASGRFSFSFKPGGSREYARHSLSQRRWPGPRYHRGAGGGHRSGPRRARGRAYRRDPKAKALPGVCFQGCRRKRCLFAELLPRYAFADTS
jgi:multidrug efflux pump subunit AcrB